MEAMTIKQLEKYVNQQMASVFKNEVAEKIKDVQAEKVREVVYNRYTSQEPYVKRRNGNGGLADKKNMKKTVTNTGGEVVLEIKNVADGNPNTDKTDFTDAPNYLAGIIEYGRPGGKGRYTRNRTDTAYQYLQARPFTNETVLELQSSGDHIDVFKKGMQSRGITVE